MNSARRLKMIMITQWLYCWVAVTLVKQICEKKIAICVPASFAFFFFERERGCIIFIL